METTHRASGIWRNMAETASPDVKTQRQPGQEIADSLTDSGAGFIVIVYDNDTNTQDQVIMILMQATSCTQEQAEIEMWEVDNLGKSVVHHGGKGECERVAGIIRTIGIRVEVVEE